MQTGIGYNNGKSHIFLCKKYNFKAARQETLPSLILAKSRGGGYTKAILRGARNRREPTNNDKQEAARKNRSTAGGMFCRKAYRHA